MLKTLLAPETSVMIQLSLHFDGSSKIGGPLKTRTFQIANPGPEMCSPVSIPYDQALLPIANFSFCQVFTAGPYVLKRIFPVSWLCCHRRISANYLKGKCSLTFNDVQFEKDEVLYPPSTAWFGFYAPNDFSTLLTADEVRCHSVLDIRGQRIAF